ncbi:hypothetical protein PMAYCL1PPCAC_09681, partial [Pristionchus mayeri]
MIFPAIIIALLLCEGTNAIKINECDTWACFVSAACVGGPETSIYSPASWNQLDDNCDRVLMSRPYSKTKWEIVIGSRQTTTNEVKVLQNDADLFSCKYDGTNSVPT